MPPERLLTVPTQWRARRPSHPPMPEAHDRGDARLRRGRGHDNDTAGCHSVSSKPNPLIRL